MQKKNYETPVIEKFEFNYSEQVVASGFTDSKPGHGWGDKNHDHKHWKDN